jgi:DNA polymerase I
LPSSYLIGYVIDAIPKYNKIELILDGFRKASVKTTYPIYVITEEPSKIMQIPDIVSYHEEEWKTIDNKKMKVYRFESRSIEAYYYLKNKVEVVNEFPSIISQTLERLKALPMHKVKIEENKVELLENENSLNFPEIKYVKVELEDWYGKSTKGNRYVLYLNGKIKETGDIRDLEIEADVAECSGISYDKVRASVKILEEKKRSPVSVKGLIEWSKTAKVLLREIRYATIGKALTTNEAWRFGIGKTR